MTFPTISQKTKPTTPPITVGSLCFGFLAVFCILLILRNSSIAVEHISRGLLLCARTVIPSLFPFAVLSEMIVLAGLPEAIPASLTAPLRRLLGLSNAGCCAVLLGMLCGFPVGAKCALLAYERGCISKQEASRVLILSSNPSSAFLIGAVGVSLWESRRFGVILYATVLGSATVVGLLYGRLQKKDESAPLSSLAQIPPAKPLTGARLFTESVSSATRSMLLVCAYVVFFSALTGTLSAIPLASSLPSEADALLFCFFELSGGVSRATALKSPGLAAALCAFAAGWSGLSVHCQALSICDGRSFDFRAYFIAKLIQGILTALVIGLLVHRLPDILLAAEGCAR